jgi:ribokinase
MLMNNNLDFLAIGDTVVDAFIRIKDAHLNCKVDNSACELCFEFGAKVPYESVTIIPAVGNSANAAVAASRLGLKAGIVTFVGNDVNGRECKFNFESEGINTEYLIMENGKMTNYHYVLWFGDERTILIKHETFRAYLPEIKHKPKWIYLSSLGEHAKDLHFEIVKYLEENPDVKLAFQPGTFQIKMGTTMLADLYKHVEFFCCNKEEAQKILNTENSEIGALLEAINNLGPKIVSITDGKNGSYLRCHNENYFMPIYPDQKPPFERTGAGDAYASTLASCLAMGLSPLDAVKVAPINSMSVVQFIGAQEGLLSKKKIEEFLENAPASYLPVKI